MSILVLCIVALVASGLTFFSGFGLGTLLLPAFALFYPIEQAVALTAIVHFLNGLFKLVLVGRHTEMRIIVAFGVPAIVTSFLGAWVLLGLSDVDPILDYTLAGREIEIMPVNLVIGALLMTFSLLEVVPRLQDKAFPQTYMPLGGVLSGFFGGLSGMQGALRSAFLARAGLTKEVFIATGVVIAMMIDVARLTVYVPSFLAERAGLDYAVLAAAVLSAFAGAALGNRYLRKMTMKGIQKIVAAMLFIFSLGLAAGII